MTFDLYFLDRPEGRTWMEAMEALDLADDGRPLSPADLDTWTALVATLTPLLPEARPRAGDGSRSFDDARTGIEVLFCPGELSISVLDRHEADADTVDVALRQVVSAVEAETGLVAYDPQRDCPYLGAAPDPDPSSAPSAHEAGTPSPDHPAVTGTEPDPDADPDPHTGAAAPSAEIHHLFERRPRRRRRRR